MIKHLKDLKEYLEDKKWLQHLGETVRRQLTQLNALGLLKHTKTEGRNFEVTTDNPEVILLLANYPPQSEKLPNLFQELNDLASESGGNFKFFLHWPHSAGYGLYVKDMVDFITFQKSWEEMRSRK